MAPARLRNASEPQLLLVTAGAGLFLLTPQPFTLTQVLPQAQDLADLTTLLPLPTGEVLLGTRHHGLLSFDGTTLAPLPTPATDITALAAPTPGALLVGTRTQGAFYLHAGTITPIQSLPDPDIESITTTPATAYLGTPRGVAQLDLATASITRTLAPSLFAHTLALNADSLQIGTLDQGVVSIPLTARVRPASITAPASPTANTQRIDAFLTPHRRPRRRHPHPPRRHHLDPRPAHCSNPHRPQHLRPRLHPHPAPSTLASSITVWTSSTPPPTPAPTLKQTASSASIASSSTPPKALSPPPPPTASSSSISREHPRQTLTRRDGLLADHVTDLAFTPPQVRSSPPPAGLTFLTASGPQSLYGFQGLVNNHVYTLATSGGDLLAGTLGGLSILQGASIRRNFTVTTSSLGHNWITALAPTTPGAYLVGTYGAGLETLSPRRRFHTHRAPRRNS